MPRILILCTANVCRSPYAAILLASLLRERPGEELRVSSAGTHAAHGAATCSLVINRLERDELGPEAVLHQPRLLTRALVDDADLILTAETSHRASVARLDPLATRRTFTLREAARLGALLPAPVGARRGGLPVTDLVAELHAARPRLALPTPHHWRRGAAGPLDVPDGHNISSTAHSAALREVRDSVEQLADLLAAVG